ncbi:TIGR00366 family protein [Paenalcaligenes niemegkensis]|uniref:TIGR00366 family protein n=1 Tax=Paenalcaligenes niemegkensis TaxID=2895469 RepID=UPI001EE8D7EF|nr:TIGR00366 family protein [Paenalcaligenes niemegkensis]MCQ9616161.1 TIGR00366 family protein [Paenalcaligenes niemegkensis]
MLTRAFERWTPTPFVIAVILTIIVMALALIYTDAGIPKVFEAWGKGLTGLLAFMTQISLAIMFGHVLAHTRRAQRALLMVSNLPKTAIQAYIMVTVFSSFATIVQWALGLIVGAVLAKAVAFSLKQRGVKVDFPLLIAGAYSGFIFAGLAYNGTIPLTSATGGSFVEAALGRIVDLSETVFTVYNMTALVLLLVLMPLLLAWLRPRVKPDEISNLAQESAAAEEQFDSTIENPTDHLEKKRFLTTVLGIFLATYLVFHFLHNGFSLSLDIVNWIMLTCILFMVSSPVELMHLIKKAASSVGDVLIQFPLYAGILGILSSTGLVVVLSDFFISVSTPATLPFIAFIVAGVVNFSVPSAGAQFALQGPIFIDTAVRLGVDPAAVIMGISYGDTWTNLLQPFFALPLLAIAGLHVRTIFKYTFPVFLLSGVILGSTMLWWGASL